MCSVIICSFSLGAFHSTLPPAVVHSFQSFVRWSRTEFMMPRVGAVRKAKLTEANKRKISINLTLKLVSCPLISCRHRQLGSPIFSRKKVAYPLVSLWVPLLISFLSSFFLSGSISIFLPFCPKGKEKRKEKRKRKRQRGPSPPPAKVPPSETLSINCRVSHGMQKRAFGK